MFEKSALIYDAYYGRMDYQAASQEIMDLIVRNRPASTTLLDVACGTGKHLEQLQEYYQVMGLDINSALLEVARERCPNVPLHHGDMVDFNLQRRFDIVTCLFSSIGYLKTIERVEQAISCMANHLQPGGLLIVEPWITPENCWTDRVTTEFVDKPDLKIVRMYAHKIEGTVSVFDINYLVGTPQGVKHFTEKEELGLFTRKEYSEAFVKAGLEVSYREKGIFPKHDRGLYTGIKKD